MVIESGTIVVNPGKDSKFVKNKKFMGKLARVYITFSGWEAFQSDPSQEKLKAFISSLRCEKVNIVHGGDSRSSCLSCPLRYRKDKDVSGCMIAKALSESIDADNSTDLEIPAVFARTSSFGYESIRMNGRLDVSRVGLASWLTAVQNGLKKQKTVNNYDDFDAAKTLIAFTKLFGFVEGLAAMEDEKIATKEDEPVILETTNGAWQSVVRAKSALACLDFVVSELRRDTYGNHPAADCLSPAREALYNRLQKAYHSLLLLGQFLPPNSKMREKIINETLESNFDDSFSLRHLVTGEITEEELRKTLWDTALRYSNG